MSFRRNQNFKNIQAKLRLHVQELEDDFEYDKVYWEKYNSDKVSIKNVIEDHHKEILHHMEQIKYHMEKVNHYKKQLDKIDHDLSVIHKKSPNHDGNEPVYNQGDVVKRPEDNKMRSRRASKTSSLKYVLQWENILEEQNGENLLNSVQPRNKYKANSDLDASTSQMVKNRIEKFEGFQKPKRQSSTVETFLDFSCENPRRIKSYPIIEDTEGEKESEIVKNIKCDSNSKLETVEQVILDRSLTDNFGKEEETEDVTKDSVKTDGEQQCAVLENDDNNLLESSKPRIVEMHYKQQNESC